MNFEVFNTEQELQARVQALQANGVRDLITGFNGNVWTLKWGN